ncbi:actin-related protein 5 isoform X2 [Electrophorus electricus]|uniref:Actin-related protein 5 n=1 Tax=Electrophorus electricus TaxID=8005 RepID=A0A4W4FXY3_ELEEL|nr:actin-related protein 5 isoform X2 [Electrophorus electricus]
MYDIFPILILYYEATSIKMIDRNVKRTRYLFRVYFEGTLHFKMTSVTSPPCKIFKFQDARASPDQVFEVKSECLHPSPAPIVIDNGSFQTRAGWACNGEEFVHPRLVFKPVAARSRGAARSETQVGNDIPNLEPLRWLLKSQFDRNVVVNFEIQELMFDYIFIHLGIETEGNVQHPLVLTEAPCNPLHCRQMMSELLFECYGVPQVAYGIDSLFSFYYSNTQCGLKPPHTGLVVSSGYHCSHVLPFINGRLDAVNCKRVNVGGSHTAAYMQRLLQLKYPAHQPAITPSRMEELLHQHCYVAVDYQQELERWRSGQFYETEVHRMQLPFSGKAAGSYASVEERQEKRVQQLRRLEEINNRHREERLQQDQERLDALLAVQELLEEGALEQFHRHLVELNMDSAEELQAYIHKLSLSVEQYRLARAEITDFEPPVDEGDGVSQTEVDLSEEPEKPEPEKADHIQPVFNLAEYHQLFVGTERLRIPEVVFRPSLIGEEQMGLTEALQFVLDQYSPKEQAAMSENVFLTGGNLLYPGVKERVERELLAIRPFQSHFKVSLAPQPALDAWFGAREWALRHPIGSQGWISRKDYEEKGGEYLSEHCASNAFIPIRTSKADQQASDGSPTEHTQDAGTSAGSLDSDMTKSAGL